MAFKEIKLEPDPRIVGIGPETRDIYLQVFVGNGQSGGSVLDINGNQIIVGNLSDKYFIADSFDAQQTALTISTTVMDINDHTNKCIITTKFSDQDGNTLFQRVDKSEADPGGFISFIGNYVFKLLPMIICIITCSFWSPAKGQAVEFDDLEMPTSPGFILYDETPEAIERPSTPQGLAISGLNAFQSGGAIEFSPYWLFNHAMFSADKVIEKKTPLLNQLSVSMAYIDQDTIGHVAFGAKTRLFQLYSKTSLESNKAALQNLSMELAKYTALRRDIEKLKNDGKISSVRATQMIDSIEKVLSSYSDMYSESIEKPIFYIDLAGAYGGTSITNSMENLAADKWGIWLAATYRPGAGSFYLSALARFSNNIVADLEETEPVIDFGARINYELNLFTFSSEYLIRSYSNNPSDLDDRLAFIGNYKLADGLYLTGSIGQNFNETKNLFVLGGINFGFSQSKKQVSE